MPRIATADAVDRSELLDFLGSRHHGVLVTHRSDGSPQMSPVTCGLDPQGRVVVSTYPGRAKTRNIRRDPRVSICVLSDEFNDAYVQVDGRAEVIDMPPRRTDWSTTTAGSPVSTRTGTNTGRPWPGRTNR